MIYYYYCLQEVDLDSQNENLDFFQNQGLTTTTILFSPRCIEKAIGLSVTKKDNQRMRAKVNKANAVWDEYYPNSSNDNKAKVRTF